MRLLCESCDFHERYKMFYYLVKWDEVTVLGKRYYQRYEGWYLFGWIPLWVRQKSWADPNPG